MHLNSFSNQHREANHGMLHTVKAKADLRRTNTEKLADFMTEAFGSMAFLLINVAIFAAWIIINTDLVPSIPSFDPFPFSLLTMIVSLEAIILAIFVLISENRSMKIDDLREETDLQVNLISEKEITKMMKMLELLLEKSGIDLSQDPELKKMLRPISEKRIEESMEREILS